MGIAWNDTFVLGIDEIDQQHRSIIEQFTRFSEAAQDGESREDLAGMATFLVEYAKLHFDTEDRYMTRYAYPRIEEQRGEHASFSRDADELVKRIEEEGASREISLALTGKMVRWITQHIRNHDRDMVNFIREQMAAD